MRPGLAAAVDAFGSAIEKPYPDRVLHVGDHLRYRRLRDREPLGGLAHAAELGDRQQDVKVVQFEPAADAIVPFHCDLPGKLWRRVIDTRLCHHQKKELFVYLTSG